MLVVEAEYGFLANFSQESFDLERGQRVSISSTLCLLGNLSKHGAFFVHVS